MSDRHVDIRYTDASQESARVQRLAFEVAKILTPNEEMFYMAAQNIMAFSVAPDCVAVTNNRVILYRSHILGRVSFDDILWQDVANSRIDQNVLSSTFRLDTIDGRAFAMAALDKDQARRLYAVAQQLEQEWREKRRVRDMEEARARSGGVYMGAADGVPKPVAGNEDPVARLAQAKSMLDQGLISEAEYDTLKAKILSAM